MELTKRLMSGNRVSISDMNAADIEEILPARSTATGDDVHGPYHRFQVKPSVTHVVWVTVVRARNLPTLKQINRQQTGKSSRLIDKAESLLKDVPDCYVTMKIPGTPNGLIRTKTIDNQTNPEWNETFTLYFDADGMNIIEIDLQEANYMKDELLGTTVYPLNGLPMNEDFPVSITFPEQENVELELLFHRKIDDRPLQLRYSIELCNDETEFLKARKLKVFRALQDLLKEDGPKTEDEVPNIALLGSGGGFRAMVGFSGAIQAMNDTGLLDCVTYVAGLSGSTWYLSWLYSQPEFPQKSPTELQPDLQRRISRCPFQLLTPKSLYTYMETIKSKRITGQPVSFTDLFGLMVGNTIIKDRLGTKLSDQRDKITGGAVPLPLYTCIHVKRKVQARVYNEWLEFSPFEIGIPKYGAFMRSEHFGSIFYMGRLIKSLPEFPIHYLQGVFIMWNIVTKSDRFSRTKGIWGSAFAILFKQLLWIMKTDPTGNIKYISPDVDEREMEDEIDMFRVQDEDETDVDYDNMSPGVTNDGQHMNGDATPMTRGFFQDVTKEAMHLWKDTVDSIASWDVLNTLGARAASIFNPLRGASFKPLFNGDFPVTTMDDDENFKGTHEPMSTVRSTVYLVDGGLGFNSPYAILLRPERKVQLYLSFDFSARPKDNTPPFKELLLAEQWAHKTDTPFPPIAQLADEFMKAPRRETYIFKDEKDPRCPIIVHFVLINIRFKEFISPGVPRVTPQEKKFADFNLFDGPNQSFSTFNFEYGPEPFAQLTGLTAFNTLCEVDAIKDILKELVTKNRFTQQMGPEMPQRGIVGTLIYYLGQVFQ